MKKLKSTWIAAVWATVFVVALIFIANWVGSRTSANSITFKGTLKNDKGNLPDGSYDFRVRGYNAVNSNDQLFQVDLKRIQVKNGEFGLTIQVQEELRNVPSIVEICADIKAGEQSNDKALCTDNKNENPYDVALCPYYIPARTTGMFGWMVTKKTFSGRSTLNCPELKNGSTVMGESFVDRANELGVNVSLFGNSADYFTKQFITNNNINQSDLPQTLRLEKNVLYISGGNSITLPEPETQTFTDTDTTYSAGAGLVLNSTTFSREAGDANGQIEVWDGSSWTDLSAGSNGQVLTIVGGTPVWQSGGAESDGVIGNEITDVNATSGLVRTGTGTSGDPYVVALTTTGVGAGTYNNVTVNTYGRVTSASNVAYLTSETDGIIGNEIVNLTGGDGKGVLTRAGTGTSGDPYTLSVATCALNQIFKSNGTSWACSSDVDTDTTYSAGNGLGLSSTTFSINSPTCSGSDKLQWNGTAFVCSSDVDTDTDTTDFNVVAQGTGGSQNIADGGTVTFNNGTGTTATRSGSTVTYNLNDTAVSPNTYGTNASVAQFTVDQQGRITGAGSVAIDFAGNAVTSVTAGAGLTNGGGPGAVTLNVGAGNGITVNANDITVDTLGAADGLSSTTSNGSGLEVLASGVGLLQGCSNNEILKWNEAGDLWGCSTDVDTDTTNFNIRANAGASANIGSGGTVSFVDGTGTSASRSGNDITFGLTNVGTAGTYGSATEVPVFTTDAQGRITGVTNTTINFPAETDGVIGNEVTNATSNSGLTRSGSGTSGSPYTLGILLPTATDGLSSTTSSGSGLELTSSGVSLIQGCANNQILKWNETSDVWACAVDTDTDTTYSNGNGLSLGGTTFSVNSPTCSGSDKLQWNGTAFVCSSDVDTDTTNFNVAAQGTGGSQNVTSGGTVTFNSGTGTTATRSGSTVTYSLNDTAVSPNTYGTSSSVAQFTVDQQGRITGASSVGIDFAGNAVTSVAAGSGLTNGGGPGAITINVGAGNGITVNANDITLDALDSADGLSSTTSNGSGLEVLASGLGLLQGCSNNQILKWNETTDVWACSTDVDTDTDTTNFNIRANAGASANISSGGTISYVDGTGTSASRSGNDIAFGLTNTGVSANTYGSATEVPVFTVDAQGRISSVTNTTINFPAEVDAVIGNEVTNATSNSGLTRSGSGTSGSPYTLGILLPSATDGLSSTTSSGSGLELTSSGVSLIQGCANNEILKWNETSDVWGCGADVSGGSLSIGTIDSQTKSTDGAVFSSGVLYMQTADATNPGLVSTGSQTFAGNKTFNGAIIATCTNTSNNVLCDGGNTRGAGIVLGANDNFGLDFETNNLVRMSIANNGAITIGATTIDQAITIDNGTGALSLGNSSDAKTINVGTGTGIDTINIGTGATAADVITFGNTGVATTLTFNSGVSTTTAATLNLNSVTTGNGLVINTTALTSGNALQIVGPSSRNLLRVQNDSADPLDDERVIIGQGGLASSKPDALARDQLYVFGRINYSWNMFSQDFLTSQVAVAADGSAFGAHFDEDAGASGTISAVSVAGASGIGRLDNPTSAAAGENEWWGTNGVGVTERSLNPVLESRMTATNQADHRSMVGFLNIASNANFDADTNISTNEIMFRKTAAGTNWETVTRAGGTEQICTSTVTTNAYHTLRIEIDDATPQVHFYADGTLVKTHTNTADATCAAGGVANTIPASATRLGWYVGNSITGATNRATDIDYMRVWSDDPPTDLLNQALSNPIVAGASTEQVNELEQKTVDLIADQNYLADVIDQLREDVTWLKAGGVAEAALRGGLVAGDTTFEDFVTFNSGVKFEAGAEFAGEVKFIGQAEFAGHVIFGSDGAGILELPAGQTSARFSFAKSYQKPPVVTITPLDYDAGFKLSEVDETGFTVNITSSQSTATRFNWIVVGRQ